MSRQSGYAVKITGFMPMDKSNLQEQKKVIDALATGDAKSIIEQCSGVMVEQKLTSRVVGDDGNVTHVRRERKKAA